MYISGIKSCVRNYLTFRSFLIMCRFTALFNLVTFLPYGAAECLDTDTLKTAALDCFQSYGTQKVYVDQSEYRLFSGIDIEILRAYCSSYTEALQCVSSLVIGCPKSAKRQVEDALNNYKSIQEELTELCTTQRLYELYAQYMSCYAAKGKRANWCYDSKLNNSDHNLFKFPSDEFCNRVRETTYCIESTMRQSCGEQAAELVHLLVKSTISGSAHCKYNIIHETTPSTMKTRENNGGSNPHHEHVTSKSQNKSSSAAIQSSKTVLLVSNLCILFIFNMFTSRVIT